jgi:hypothetical protein
MNTITMHTKNDKDIITKHIHMNSKTIFNNSNITHILVFLKVYAKVQNIFHLNK